MVEEELARLMECDVYRIDDGMARTLYDEHKSNLKWVEYEENELMTLFFLKKLARMYDEGLKTYLFAHNPPTRGRFRVDGNTAHGFFWNNGSVVYFPKTEYYTVFIHLMEARKWNLPHDEL